MRADAEVRRLPWVCLPQQGESFASWMDRTAADLGAPTGILAEQLGLPFRDQNSGIPAYYGIATTPQTLKHIATGSGLPPEDINRMHLSHWDGTAVSLTGFDLNREQSLLAVRRREWVHLHSTAACPTCLAEHNGAWQMAWKLTLAPACLKHRTLLIETCPDCGGRIRTGNYGRPPILSRITQAAPTHCARRTRTGTCTTDLTHAPTIATTHGHQVQAMLLNAAEGKHVHVAGQELTPHELYDHVKALIGLIRFAADPGLLPANQPTVVIEAFESEVRPRGSRSGGTTSYIDQPRTAAAAAGFLATLEPALLANSIDEQLELLTPICERALARRLELLRFPHLNLPRHIEAVVRTPLGHARVARYAPQRSRWLSAGVPELLDSATYEAHLAEFLPRTANLTGRRFAALAIARHLGARSWRQAGEQTGGDGKRAVTVADAVSRRINEPERFWAAVANVAQTIEKNPTDFTAYRAALSTIDGVTKQMLPPEALRGFGAWTPARARLAHAWLWEHVAGGDWRTSPTMLDPTWSASAESRREMYRQFSNKLTRTQKTALRGLGLQLVTQAAAA